MSELPEDGSELSWKKLVCYGFIGLIEIIMTVFIMYNLYLAIKSRLRSSSYRRHKDSDVTAENLEIFTVDMTLRKDFAESS